MDLAEDKAFLAFGDKVEDTIADHAVDSAIFDGNRGDLGQLELDVFSIGSRSILAAQVYHGLEVLAYSHAVED